MIDPDTRDRWAEADRAKRAARLRTDSDVDRIICNGMMQITAQIYQIAPAWEGAAISVTMDGNQLTFIISAPDFKDAEITRLRAEIEALREKSPSNSE